MASFDPGRLELVGAGVAALEGSTRRTVPGWPRALFGRARVAVTAIEPV